MFSSLASKTRGDPNRKRFRKSNNRLFSSYKQGMTDIHSFLTKALPIFQSWMNASALYFSGSSGAKKAGALFSAPTIRFDLF